MIYFKLLLKNKSTIIFASSTPNIRHFAATTPNRATIFRIRTLSEVFGPKNGGRQPRYCENSKNGENSKTSTKRRHFGWIVWLGIFFGSRDQSGVSGDLRRVWVDFFVFGAGKTGGRYGVGGGGGFLLMFHMENEVVVD